MNLVSDSSPWESIFILVHSLHKIRTEVLNATIPSFPARQSRPCTVSHVVFLSLMPRLQPLDCLFCEGLVLAKILYTPGIGSMKRCWSQQVEHGTCHVENLNSLHFYFGAEFYRIGVNFKIDSVQSGRAKITKFRSGNPFWTE